MKSLLIHLPSLDGGGAERVVEQLAPAFIARGYHPTFVINYINVPIVVPPSVEIICLGRISTKAALRPLIRVVGGLRPDVVWSGLPHTNIAMALALKIARHRAIFVPTYHSVFSREGSSSPLVKAGMAIATRLAMRGARRIVAVSDGVADDLAAHTGVSRDRIVTIYNPVVTPRAAEMSKESPDHPWFGPGCPPVVLAVGRLRPLKDFATLLRAFAVLARERDVRLMILGEGPLRDELAQLAETLGIADRFAMVGFKQNPLSYIAAASVLVMSSQFEGFGNVLVEGLACGTPTMSTDCPYGPAEILENGRYGPLVPVGDAAAMAKSMGELLDAPPQREPLIERAQDFTVDRAADAYVRLFES